MQNEKKTKQIAFSLNKNYINNVNNVCDIFDESCYFTDVSFVHNNCITSKLFYLFYLKKLFHFKIFYFTLKLFYAYVIQKCSSYISCACSCYIIRLKNLRRMGLIVNKTAELHHHFRP